MRVRSHPELHPRRGIFARQRRSHRAFRARRSARRIAAARPGTDDGAPRTRCRRRRSAPPPVPAAAHCRCAGPPSAPWHAMVTSSNWQPSRKSISGWSLTCGLQRRLQIGAMHHPIGRAGAKGGGLAERQAGDLAAGARAHDVDGFGRHRARRRAAAAGRVRPGCGWRWAKAAGRRRLPPAVRPFPARRRESPGRRAPARRQSPDPGTSDDDGARVSTPPETDQATLSFSTHSGGRASPAPRSAAKRYSVEQ